MLAQLELVVLGLSITSSWGNGHATTYRALVRELAARGHDVLFLERDVPWYARHRDMPSPAGCRTELYGSVGQLQRQYRARIERADLVIVGSFVPQGIEVGRWVTQTAAGVTAFYDIDTPVTLSLLQQDRCEYLSPDLIPGFDLYLSFSSGPVMTRIRHEYGAQDVRPLHCSVDPELYYPEPAAREPRWTLGYMGTYSSDRQPGIQRMLIEPARRRAEARFVVAGPQYPAEIQWPANVERIEHLPPTQHRSFYNAQKFTLNLTRADMVQAGYSPSVRLFEAAACGVPIISDYWEGLETFFEPERELLIARSPEDVLRWMESTPQAESQAIGERARQRVMSEHTAAHRARQLEGYALEMLKR